MWLPCVGLTTHSKRLPSGAPVTAQSTAGSSGGSFSWGWATVGAAAATGAWLILFPPSSTVTIPSWLAGTGMVGVAAGAVVYSYTPESERRLAY